MAAMKSTTPMKGETARRIRSTAATLEDRHPELIAHQHLRDAAKVLEHGSLQGAKRHLDAAMELLTPRNLIRHGITDDDGHADAKALMHETHRHRLAIQDIEDIHARSVIAARRARLKELGEDDRDYDDDELHPGQEPIAASGGDGAAVELAFWEREPRNLKTGRWIESGSVAAGKLHDQQVIGATRKGQQFVGTYHHPTRRVLVRHGAGVEVSHIQPATPEARMTAARQQQGARPRHRRGSLMRQLAAHSTLGGGFSGWDAVDRAIELAAYDNPYLSPHGNPLLNWMNEARDPHTGKWISGPAEIHNVREHMGGAHGFGHSLGHLDEQELLERHNLLHQEPQFRNPQGGHHHVVRGGGAEYARKREARDFMRAALTVPESMLPNLGYAGFLPATSNPYKGMAESYSNWAEVDHAIELSARTAMLERTPAPRGRPGGPGLYREKGMGHTPYLQQIVKALIEKRGMPSGKAYAIARAAIRKWMRGGGHVHPEVMAAAGRAEAGELAKQARAKSHATGWEQISQLIELAMVAPQGGGGTPTRKPRQGQRQRPQSSNWQGEQRVPKGQFGGGRFSKGGGGGQAKGSRAQRRAALVTKIRGLKAQIAALEGKYRALTGTHHGTASKRAAKAAKAQSPQQAAAAAKRATAAKSASSTPRKKTGTGKAPQTAATIHGQIVALRGQLHAAQAALRAL